MNTHPSHDPSGNTEPKNTAANQEPPLRGLAIGPSGPAWTLPVRASAENFNPFHDELGRFATSGGAAASHGSGHHKHSERPTQHKEAVDRAAQPPASKPKEYHGKVTTSAFSESISQGNCLPAALCEAVAQVETMRTGSDEQVPKGVKNDIQSMEFYIRQRFPDKSFDFSSIGGGAAIERGLPILKEKFNVDWQEINRPDQIPEALKHGPIIVAALDGGHKHGELILSMAGPNSYNVYNPLNPVKRAATLDASKIISDGKGLVAYALRPLKKER